MWKKTLLAAICGALIATPLLAEGWFVITSERTATVTASPTLAGIATPIQAGVQEVRVVALTNPAWILFQLTPPRFSTSELSGQMSRLGFLLPTGVPEIFRVVSSMQWHVQGEGGAGTVHVSQISR